MNKIAYVFTKFPQVTETFVLREVESISQQGFDIQPYSLKPVSYDDMRDDLMKKWYQKTIYVPPSLSFECLSLFWGGVFRYSLRVVWCAGIMMWLNRTRIRILLEAFLLFPQCAFLLSAFKKGKIVWAHAHFGGNATTTIWILNRIIGLKYSFTPHAFELYQKKNIDNLLSLKIRNAEFVVAISEFNRRFLQKIINESNEKEKFPIIHYGVNKVSYKNRCQDYISPYQLLSVGRLVEKKGHEFLIKAMAHLEDQNISCQIIGEGPLRESLQDLIAFYGLEGKVKLLGQMSFDQIKQKLKQADIFCLSCVVSRDGDQDGIPVALIEALSYGLPTISTTVSGIPELIEDGVNGLLVPPGDDIAIKKAIQTLVEDEMLRAKLSLAGIDKVERDFNLHVEAGKLAHLFSLRAVI